MDKGFSIRDNVIINRFDILRTFSDNDNLRPVLSADGLRKRPAGSKVSSQKRR